MRSSWKTKEGLFKELQTNIKPESAMKWLIENDLIVRGDFHRMKTLTSALLQLSSGTFSQLKKMITRMQVIALCMENIVQTHHMTEALDMVIGKVEDIVKELIRGLLGGVRMAMKEAKVRIARQKDAKGKDKVERIIEKAIQTTMKPSYAQALDS